MSRFSDVKATAPSSDPVPLPVIDWCRIGAQAPRLLDFTYGGPDAALPKADAVVITWTSAEWSALDHVFLNGGGTRMPDARDWQNGWYRYTRRAPPPPPAAKPAQGDGDKWAPAPEPPLWGSYVPVEIDAKGGKLKVLLFKSNAHLAHAPGFSALAAMTAQIIKEAKPRFLYSIGTAGGARATQPLGGIVITNTGKIELQDPINRAYFGLNGRSFACTKWFPPMQGVATVQKELFFPLSNVVTYPALQALIEKLHEQVPGSEAIGLDDILTPTLFPEKLHKTQATPMRGTPLLTTDYYFISDGSDAKPYAFLEMDDAVLGKVAGELGVKYAFARNISDPIVPAKDADGKPLAPELRKRWSGLIYETFGLYTSVNGAIATWATLAGIG